MECVGDRMAGKGGGGRGDRGGAAPEKGGVINDCPPDWGTPWKLRALINARALASVLSKGCWQGLAAPTGSSLILDEVYFIQIAP